MVTALAWFISLLARHFMQQAYVTSTSFLTINDSPSPHHFDSLKLCSVEFAHNAFATEKEGFLPCFGLIAKEKCHTITPPQLRPVLWASLLPMSLLLQEGNDTVFTLCKKHFRIQTLAAGNVKSRSFLLPMCRFLSVTCAPDTISRPYSRHFLCHTPQMIALESQFKRTS